MRKGATLVWLVIGSLSMTDLACGSEGPQPWFDRPSPMIDGFESGMTLQEAMAVPSAMSLDWKVMEQSRFKTPSEEEVVAVLAEADGYDHLGFRGTLAFQFHNDMLSRAFFHPERFDEYVDELNRVEGVDVRETSKDFRRESTVIWSYRRFGDEFVGWRDERILNHFVHPSP